MKLLNTFFGMLLRRGDIDFMNKGTRDAIVQSSIDMTGKLGGVINGLDVYSSVDKQSIMVKAGSFYSSGEFSQTNNMGGGERASIYVTQSFTGLPYTSSISNQDSYLLVYAKIATTNTDPDPTKAQTPITSKNIQTGENVLTRQYPVGVIVVSNPVLRSEIDKYNGVPLALVQTDINGSIVSIDTSVKRNYIIGGCVDVANQQIIPAAIKPNTITTAMIADGQVTGAKFLSGTINSAAIASYDGSDNVATSGNGIATAHLKNEAVTSAKISYKSSLNGLAPRNYVINSSFEDTSGGLSNWIYYGGTGTSASVETNTDNSMFGLKSAKLVGQSSASIPKDVAIYQNIDFGGPINGRPLTAFFYAKPESDFKKVTEEAGTNGINGVISFYNTISDANNDNGRISGTIFASYTGTTLSDNKGFIKLQTSSPIVLETTATKASAIRISLSGTYSNTVYVDGVYVGLTDITPGFDVATVEQITLNPYLNADNITAGQLLGDRIAPGAIKTTHVRDALGGVVSDNGFGIRGDQIRANTITASNIATGTITNVQLSAGVSAIPQGAILMFLSTESSTLNLDPEFGCPTGFKRLTQFNGHFPMGVNTSSTSTTISTLNQSFGANITALKGYVDGAGNHNHGANQGCAQTGGGNCDAASNGHWHSDAGAHGHSYDIIPFVTVLFCQKI